MTNTKQACTQAPFLHPRFEAARRRRIDRRERTKGVLLTAAAALGTVGLAYLAVRAI